MAHTRVLGCLNDRNRLSNTRSTGTSAMCQSSRLPTKLRRPINWTSFAKVVRISEEEAVLLPHVDESAVGPKSDQAIRSSSHALPTIPTLPTLLTRESRKQSTPMQSIVPSSMTREAGQVGELGTNVPRLVCASEACAFARHKQLGELESASLDRLPLRQSCSQAL
jgi:hypothetical protein